MDIEGTIQFIHNQQAQNVADIHQLQVSQKESSAKFDKLSEKIDKLHEDVGTLHEIVKKHEDYHIVTGEMMAKLASWQEDYPERQDWLFEGHKKLIDLQFRTDAKVDKLVGAQLATESKLKSFIDEVRKNVPGGNGKKNGGNGGKSGGKGKK